VRAFVLNSKVQEKAKPLYFSAKTLVLNRKHFIFRLDLPPKLFASLKLKLI